MSSELLTTILKEVSRSFYLTMRILPQEVRRQISLAYLLARTSDTIADTELVPLESRLCALEQFNKRVQGATSEPLDLDKLSQSQASPAEKIILQRCEESLRLLNECSAADQRLIRQVLEVIVSGQKLDLERFAGAGENRIVALRVDDEFEDYTYRVAGCVGEFWTRICRTHLYPDVALDDQFLLTNGVRFGKGLQMVNILRDLPRDLRQGRCYIPRKRLDQAGLKPEDLLDPKIEMRFRPLYAEYLRQAEAHLHAGWEYTNRLPRNQARVRLACAWPILLGLRTLHKLKEQNVLDPTIRIKVTRSEVRNIILKSLILYPFSHRWRSQAYPEKTTE